MTTYVNTPNKGTLNLRSEPNSNSKILARIPYNTALEVESTINDWSKVIYNNIEGYVMNQFLGDKKSITKDDLQKIYSSLKDTLKTIENILK